MKFQLKREKMGTLPSLELQIEGLRKPPPLSPLDFYADFSPVQDPGDQIAAQSIFLPHYHRFFSSAQQARRMLQGTDMTLFLGFHLH